MNSTPLHRRAIRDYDEIRRMAIEATEREAVTREPKAPEPCNFCAPDELTPATDRFAELAQVLGRYWLFWLIAFTGLCIVSALLAVGLFAELVTKP